MSSALVVRAESNGGRLASVMQLGSSAVLTGTSFADFTARAVLHSDSGKGSAAAPTRKHHAATPRAMASCMPSSPEEAVQTLRVPSISSPRFLLRPCLALSPRACPTVWQSFVPLVHRARRRRTGLRMRCNVARPIDHRTERLRHVPVRVLLRLFGQHSRAALRADVVGRCCSWRRIVWCSVERSRLMLAKSASTRSICGSGLRCKQAPPPLRALH